MFLSWSNKLKGYRRSFSSILKERMGYLRLEWNTNQTCIGFFAALTKES